MSSINPDKLVSDFLDREIELSRFDQRPSKRIKIEEISTIGDFIFSNQINISMLSSETKCRLTLSVFKEISKDSESFRSQKLIRSILLKDSLLKEISLENLVVQRSFSRQLFVELNQLTIENVAKRNQLLSNVPIIAFSLVAQSDPQLIEPLVPYLDNTQLIAASSFLPKGVLFSVIEQVRASLDLKKT